jgi:hypothetical protein
MPAEQRGSTYKTSTGYGIRWFDENGRRRRQAGFSSASKARMWFRDVELPRMRGGLIDEPLTLREFSDRYVARYEVDRSPVTVRTLRWRLVRTLDEFGDVKLADLRAGDRSLGGHASAEVPLRRRSSAASGSRRRSRVGVPGQESREGNREEREADDRRADRARTGRRGQAGR